jgi:gas vesicle protein
MAQNESSCCCAGSAILSFLVGGLVGAGIALLVAPKSGKETRQQLRELAEDVKGQAEGYIEQMKDQVSSVVEQGKSLLEGQKSILASAVEVGKEVFEKEKQKLKKE